MNLLSLGSLGLQEIIFLKEIIVLVLELFRSKVEDNVTTILQ